MAGSYSKLADQRFINWIKARIASDIVRECIAILVDKEINKFHKDILSSVASKEQIENGDLCYNCATKDVVPSRTNTFRPCRKNICNRFQQKIRESHNFSKPSWNNTHAQEWCRNHWEVAKCFMPPGGYVDKTSVGETDLNGILSVMVNHSGFKNIIDENICQEVREYGNDLRHSANLYVSDQALRRYLNTLVAFLKCSGTLQTDTKAKEAVQSIQKIQTEELSISTGDITRVLEKSIEEERKRSAEEITKQTKTNMQVLKEAIEEAKQSGVSNILSAEKTTIENINTAVSAAVSTGIDKIESTKTEALAQIEASTRQTLDPSEHSYIQCRNMLKDDLVDFNCSKHSTIPITPLFEETDVPITEFYVRPEFVAIERQTSGLLGPEIKIPIDSLHDVFYKAGKKNNEVYLTSDAGFGKTSFSKYLVITWCHALHSYQPTSQYFSDEDVNVMKEFDFVFLIHLRDVNLECDVDDMIFEHIIKQLSHSANFALLFLQNVLHRENCLVILDGLDEWSHPSVPSCGKMFESIPHRKVRRACTILTTTRPWKMGTINIKASQIDKRVELCSQSEASIGRLKYMAVSKLVEDDDVKGVIEKLNAEIKDRELANLESNPMLLMYLICLCCEGRPLGKTKSQLYSQIVQLLLVRAKQKAESKSTNVMETENLAFGALDQEVIPWCFREHDLCSKYYQLFKALGRLAFNSLFDETRSNTLVFDKTKAIILLSEECLRVSLSSGILTESIAPRSLLIRRNKISFCHKTVQEFFAALHMQATPDRDDMISKTLNICKSVDGLLEMSNVFVFLSGLNYKTFECLSDKLATVVNADESITKYREGCISSTSNYSFIVKPLKDIQNMYIHCIKEIQLQDCKNVKFCLQDVFIDEDCSKGAYKLNLMKVKVLNEGSIKSISIRTEGISNLGEIVETFQLEKETSLDKINFRGECCSNDIESLLSAAANNLKCVEILSSVWQGNTFAMKYVPWTDALSNTFQTMRYLEALHLYAFVMTHAQLNEMITYIERRTKIKDIALLNLKCNDHNSACSGCQLDLSRHNQLKLLSLDNLPVSRLSVNVSALEDSVVGRLSNSSVLSSFLAAMKTAAVVSRLTCRNINSENQIDELVETMGEMAHLKYVGILYINFGERENLLSHKMSNIALVRLVEVTMKCCLLRNLVKIIKTFRQSVTAVLFKCTVITEDEYEKLKWEIKSDERILVLTDAVLKSQNKQFSFKSTGIEQP